MTKRSFTVCVPLDTLDDEALRDAVFDKVYETHNNFDALLHLVSHIKDESIKKSMISHVHEVYSDIAQDWINETTIEKGLE